MTEGTHQRQREEVMACVGSNGVVARETLAQMMGSKFCSATFKLCDPEHVT